MAYLDIFKKDTVLIGKLGEEKAHTIWVMSRYLNDSDVDNLAATALTDGPDDKKIDFILLDHDGKRIIFTQGYFASRHRDAAPANKASDLNTAAAWLLSGDLASVPNNMREIVEECRQALTNDDVESIEMFYVHNLPESVNVARELQTVEDHFRSALGSASISVRAVELGSAKIQHLYDAQESHIEVKDEINFPVPISFIEDGPDWTAYVTSVPGVWLHSVYNKHQDALFSANYRGFLGGGRRRRVNAGIQESAEGKSSDFWAFNNGITILTMGMKKDKSNKHVLLGMSIINGAQTTGSIGSVDLTKNSLTDLRVLCRIIESSNTTKIQDIVRFNNTQNAITTWDQYSNDPDQKRLVSEFNDLNFTYNIKRGFLGAGDQLGIDEVVQPLLAFHGRPQDAIRGKNQIFDRKPLYQNAFDGKKARHVLFVFSLAKAIDNKRLLLKEKSNAGELLVIEEEQLEIMRNLRFKPFFIWLMAATIETSIGKRSDPMTIGFTPDVCKSDSLVGLIARWEIVVDTLISLITANEHLRDYATHLGDENFMGPASKQINALLHAMKAAKQHKAFADLVTGT